jgi:hypothetical protein
MSRAETVTTLTGFPERLASAAHAAADVAVQAGEWSPAQVVRHLIVVERAVWHVRLHEVATQDDPHWSWFGPGPESDDDDVGLAALLDDFAGARAETVATIRGLDHAGWARSGTHSTFGVLDVAGLVRVAIDHDAEHLRGIDPAG